MKFSTYNYEKTVNYEEYINIKDRSAEVVDLLWKGVEFFLGVSLPKKPSEIIEYLFPGEENPPQRWDIYAYKDGYDQYSNFTLIPSNIPTAKINNLDINEYEINASWEGTDQDTYDQLVFLPDNKDITKYLDGNSTSDLTYSYRITQDGSVYDEHNWTAYNSKTSTTINIFRSGNYTLELRVKDEVDNIGRNSADFSIEGEEPELIELKNDDGTIEATTGWGGTFDSAKYVADGQYGYGSILTTPQYPFKIENIRIYFTSKHTEEKGFYLHVTEGGKELLPSNFLIPFDEVNVLHDWWSKNILDYNVIVNSNKFEITVFEKYLPHQTDPPLPNTHGWKFGVDKSSFGNSYTSYPNDSHYPYGPGELMIRAEGYVLSQ